MPGFICAQQGLIRTTETEISKGVDISVLALTSTPFQRETLVSNSTELCSALTGWWCPVVQLLLLKGWQKCFFFPFLSGWWELQTWKNQVCELKLMSLNSTRVKRWPTGGMYLPTNRPSDVSERVLSCTSFPKSKQTHKATISQTTIFTQLGFPRQDFSCLSAAFSLCQQDTT